MSDLLQDARKKLVADRQAANAAKTSSTVLSPVNAPQTTAQSELQKAAQTGVFSTPQLQAAQSGVNSGQSAPAALSAARPVQKPAAGPPQAFIPNPQSGLTSMPTNAPTTLPLNGQTTAPASPELAPLFGDTPPTPEMGPTFDREFFDPLALYQERAAEQQLGQLDQYKTDQTALTAQETAARDAALEQRRISAEQQRAAERNVAGLEQKSLLSQIDRSKRASFNQLRGQLASMGAYGTTGSGDLDFAILGEIYDGKSTDVRLAANKGLRDIEIAYWQIRDSIESDQSKSDIQRAQELQTLNSKVQTEWQAIQAEKQQTITRLAEEAYGIGAEEQKRIRDQAIDLVTQTVANGQQVTSALLKEAGYTGVQIDIARQIMGQAADGVTAARRLEWINSAILPDFTIDDAAITQAANLLGIPKDTLLADAEKWAAAAKWEYQQKLKTGSGTKDVKLVRSEQVRDPETQELKFINYYSDGTQVVTDAYGNQENVPTTTTPNQSGLTAPWSIWDTTTPPAPSTSTVMYPPIKVEKTPTGKAGEPESDIDPTEAYMNAKKNPQTATIGTQPGV